MAHLSNSSDIRRAFGELAADILDSAAIDTNMHDCVGCVHQRMCEDEGLLCAMATRGLLTGERWERPRYANRYVPENELIDLQAQLDEARGRIQELEAVR